MTQTVQVPFDRQAVEEIRARMNIDIARASIREMDALINEVERRFDTRFIRMEFGIPGLPAAEIATAAEAEHLRGGAANTYAPFQGLPRLKAAGSRFAKAFIDLDIPPECVIPTIGAMQGCLISLGLAGYQHPERNTILFLDPGFPVNKLQTRFLGLNSINLDLKEYRGKALCEKVDQLCAEHGVAGCLWSSPNNPSWVILNEEELEGLARVFDKHGVFAVEDFAYFGMDFRKDYSVPFQPPYQPTIARYTHRVFMVISSSKLFSYAGQRCGLVIIPPKFAAESYPNLAKRFSKPDILQAFIQGGIYLTSASVPQGPQAGLAALLEATIEGRYNPWPDVREYERRAAFMKKAFLDHGFHLVYDEDLGDPLADGFYFTIGYPGMTSGQLSAEIVHYGISAITLTTTGSKYEGLRACTSLTKEEQFGDLVYRLRRFREDHPVT